MINLWHTSSLCLFQEGRPLATVAEGSTELVDASSNELVSRQVLMAEEGEGDGDFPITEFDDVSEDECDSSCICNAKHIFC
jgi:hypothetical protein